MEVAKTLIEMKHGPSTSPASNSNKRKRESECTQHRTVAAKTGSSIGSKVNKGLQCKLDCAPAAGGVATICEACRSA